MASPRTRRVLQDLRTSNENNRCFECNTHNPQWASVSLGIWICLECSGKHRSLGVHLSFVRSLTMDKWKDAELEKMKVGGNRRVRDFLESQDDWDDSRPITVKYNCRAAALLRDKISTEAQGRAWSEATSSVSKQKSTSSNSTSSSRPSSLSAGTMHKSASSPNAGAMLSAHGEGGYQSAGGGYDEGTGGYQQMGGGGGGGYQSGGGGYVDPKQAFFDRRQAENAARPDNIAPSQGGRYSGFGYSMDPAPRAQSSEVMDTALQALTSGWSLLSVGATKMARSATDSALKISSTATEKITEVSQTVSEKMREGTLGDELLSQAQQVAGKVTDLSRRGLGQVQTWVGNPGGAAGNNRLDYQSPAGNSRGERSSLLAAGNGAGNGSAGGYQQIQHGPESGGGGAPLMSGDPGNNGQDWGWDSANSSTKSGGMSSDLQWGSGAAWEDAHLAAPLTKAAKSRGASNSSKKSTNVSSAPAASSVKSSALDEASLIDLDGSGKDQWKSWEDDAWDSLTRKG